MLDTYFILQLQHVCKLKKYVCVYNVASINVTATHHLNSSHVIYLIARL
jgi:hypothetical protein